MNIKKLISILDFFLPENFNDNASDEEMYRARGFIGSSLIGIITSFIYIIVALGFKSPYIVKIVFFSNIAFVGCLLFIFKISPFSQNTRVKHLSLVYAAFMNGFIFSSIYFDLGLGFFGVVWFFPMLISASFLFNKSTFFKIFVLMFLSNIFLAIVRYNNFYEVVLKNVNFKISYFFYFFACFLLIFCYLYLKAILDEIAFLDKVTKNNSAAGNSKYLALENMTAKIAHNVNNPLFVIQGKVQQLRSYANEDKDNKKAMDELVQEIETSIYDLSNKVKLVSAFAKEGRSTQMVVVDVEKIIKDKITSFSNKFFDNHIVVEVYVDSKLSLICYPSYIRETLACLLANAIEALGQLNQKNKVIRIKSSVKDQWVYIEIQDNGREIPEDVIQKMFKNDFSTKKSTNYLGNGLAIAQGLTEMQDGTLTYFREDKMNVFRIELPSYEEDEVEDEYEDELDSGEEDEL